MAVECLGPEMSGGGLGAHGEGGRYWRGDEWPGGRARPRPGGWDISRVDSRQPGVTPPCALRQQGGTFKGPQHCHFIHRFRIQIHWITFFIHGRVPN